MSDLKTRVLASLAFGFSLIFIFSLIVQFTADFLNWLMSAQIRFLFPRGMSRMFEDMDRFWAVMSSLTVASLVVSLVFFFVRANRKRPSILDMDDEPPGGGLA